jgi:hypothetical protein
MELFMLGLAYDLIQRIAIAVVALFSTAIVLTIAAIAIAKKH